MSKISIETTICRTINGEDFVIDISATGDFFQGELYDYDYTAFYEGKETLVELTEKEKNRIEQMLIETAQDDWAEEQWQSEREHENE